MGRSQLFDDSRASSRRTLLRWGAVLGLSTLAGCTEEIGREFPPNKKAPLSEIVPEIPVKKRTTVLEMGITGLDTEAITTEEEFTTTLEAAGIEIESLSKTYDVLKLEYTTQRSQDEGVLHELGPIAGAYAALVDAGYTATALDVTIAHTDSSTVGFVEVSTENAARYNAGEYSAAEYGELVASSIKSKRNPPRVKTGPGS